jgi:hypothetical protein
MLTDPEAALRAGEAGRQAAARTAALPGQVAAQLLELAGARA